MIWFSETFLFFLLPPLWCRCSSVPLASVLAFPPEHPAWPSVLPACPSSLFESCLIPESLQGPDNTFGEGRSQEHVSVWVFGVVGSCSFEADCWGEGGIVCAPASPTGCLQGSEWSVSIRKLSFRGVWVCVSRKGQLRTKSVTHYLKGPDKVPVLFATRLVENKPFIWPHTHCFSLLLPVTMCIVLHSKNKKLTCWKGCCTMVKR